MPSRRRFLPLLALPLLAACAATPPPPAAEPEPRVYLVFFDVDSFWLSPVARETMARLADRMSRDPSVRVTIEGHTDATGSADANIRLGERRAGSVRDFLAARGVPPLRMQTMTYGASESGALGPAERASALARRVVVRVD
jgi:peptidoglycan-associated lipoprotein